MTDRLYQVKMHVLGLDFFVVPTRNFVWVATTKAAEVEEQRAQKNVFDRHEANFQVQIDYAISDLLARGPDQHPETVCFLSPCLHSFPARQSSS